MQFILLAVSGIAWFWLRNRVLALEAASRDLVSVYEVSALTRRVFALEQQAAPPPSDAAEQPPVAEPAPPAPMPPPAEPLNTPEPVELPLEPPVPPPSPSPFRQAIAGRQWEAVVGGSLLNAVGAIVLVIGIALFLAYSFARMSPAGRASLAAIASIAILAAGVSIERRPRYRLFARGLIGAGWAALYATAYAIYAIPAARIVSNPIAGSAILLAVALGMVAHSLRYRAQAVTAVAYFAAFAALAVTPSSPFAVSALVPIAASVLYLAAKFEWDSLPLFGLIATYLTCISRGESDASLASTQALFVAFWLLFELFDLRRVKLGRIAGGLEFLFPLNAAGVLGLSYLAWAHHAPDRLWFASACAAALFLASSIARAIVQPRRAAPSEFLDRLRAGSFEASLVVSAGLALLAIVGRATGIWAAAGLALEAEILYLAGVRFDSRFVRGLGATLFACSLSRLAFVPYRSWTPALIFHAALFYLNRAIRRPAAYFSYAASAAIAIVLFAETPHAVLGFAWVAFGCVLLELGLLRGLREFRLQAYCLLSTGVFAACSYPVANPHGPWWALALTIALVYAAALQAGRIAASKLAGWLSVATCVAAAILVWRTIPTDYAALAWMALALALFELGALCLPAQLRFALGPLTLLAALGTMATHQLIKPPSAAAGLTYLCMCLGPWIAAAQLTLRPPAGSRDWESRGLRDLLATVGLAAALAATWMFSPAATVAIIWTALALALLEAGVWRREASFHLLALAALAAAYDRIVSLDLAAIDCAVAIAATYWTWRRFQLRDAPLRLLLWAPPALAVAAIAAHAAGSHAALWIALMVPALQLAAQTYNLPDLKWQARILGLTACLWALAGDVDPALLAISIPTAAVFFAAMFIARRRREMREALYLSLLGTVLLVAILYGRVSGGLLTVAWGLLALSLLGAGFAARERILRLEGLSLFLICILKLFLYDLRNLDTLYRILSFVALGLILLSVSWIYSRFREQLERLL